MTNLTQNAINFVPEFQRSQGNIQSFYSQIGALLDAIGATINNFQTYSDYATMNLDNLQWFVQEKGITFPRNLSASSERSLSKDIVNLHRANGTVKALEFIFNIAGLQVQIDYAWIKKSDIINQTPPPYNYVYGSQSTINNDGAVWTTSGCYFNGTDTFGKVFTNMPISGETYTPDMLMGNIDSTDNTTGDELVKLPYIRITVLSQAYNAFTSNYSVNGVTYSYTTDEQYAITQEILNYFLDTSRPAHVAIIEISTPFVLSDTVNFQFNDADKTDPAYNLDDGGMVTTSVNMGWVWDGTVTLGISMDRYLLGEDFGGFEFGANTMDYYASPAEEVLTRTYDFTGQANNLIANGDAGYLGSTNEAVFVADPDFQLSSGTTLPQDWTWVSGTGSATVSYNTTGELYGTQDLVITSESTSEAQLICGVVRPVKSGGTVTLQSVSAASAGTAKCSVLWFQPTGSPSSTPRSDVSQTATSLTSAVDTFDVPSDATYFQLAISIVPSATGNTATFNRVRCLYYDSTVNWKAPNWTGLVAGSSPLSYSLTNGPSNTPCFESPTGSSVIIGDSPIGCVSTHTYKMHLNLGASIASTNISAGVICLDGNKNPIPVQNSYRDTTKTTTLYSAISVGDTTANIQKASWPASGYIQFSIRSDYSDLPNSNTFAYTAINTANNAYDQITLAAPIQTAYAVGSTVGFAAGGAANSYFVNTTVSPPSSGFADYTGNIIGQNAPTVAPTANQMRIGTQYVYPVLALDTGNAGAVYAIPKIELIDCSALGLMYYVPTRIDAESTVITPVDSTVSLYWTASNRFVLGVAEGNAIWNLVGTITGKKMIAGTSIKFGNAGSHDTIVRATGSWVIDNFVAGDQIQVSGTTSAGIYTVSSIGTTTNTNDTLILISNGVVGTETTSAATVVNCIDTTITKSCYAVAVNIITPSQTGVTQLTVTQTP